MYFSERGRIQYMPEQLRIVHAADFHLGSPFSALSPRKAAIRQAEQEAAFHTVIELCRTENTRLLLLAGDLLDHLRIPAGMLRSFMGSFSGIPDTTVVIAPGNHDPYTQDSPYFMQTWPANVHIFTGEFSCVYFPDLGAAVWGAAFTGPRAEHTLCPASFSVSRAKESYPQDTIHIILMHGELAETEAEQHAYNPVLRDWIKGSGADYAALGHVHEKSGICRAGDTYFAYPGCPESRGFDEPGPRGVYCGTLSRGRADLQFIPVGQRSYFCPEISVDGCITQNELENRVLSFLQQTYGNNYMRDSYRITLTGELLPDFLPNIPGLRERLAEVVFSVRIKDRTCSFQNPQELRRENSLRGIFADTLLSRIEAAGQDPDRISEYRQALTIGLRAFEGEVQYSEDQ